MRRLFRQRCDPFLFRGHDGRISMHSSCFSKTVHDSTSRLPPLAPAGSCSPASSVLSRRYDALPPSRRTSCPSLGGTSAFHSFSSLLGGRVRRQGLELVTRCLQPGIRRGANRVLPSSWGTTIVRLHMIQSDSGRTARTRPLRCSNMALGISKAKAPTTGLSKLNSMAFGLAVYASPGSLPHHDARLTSGRWSGATGRAFHPQGSDERFQICFLTSHPPFPSFAWHNEIDRRDTG